MGCVPAKSRFRPPGRGDKAFENGASEPGPCFSLRAYSATLQEGDSADCCLLSPPSSLLFSVIRVLSSWAWGKGGAT